MSAPLNLNDPNAPEKTDRILFRRHVTEVLKVMDERAWPGESEILATLKALSYFLIRNTVIWIIAVCFIWLQRDAKEREREAIEKEKANETK